MQRYCICCGRKLTKGKGIIGPKCLAKLQSSHNVYGPRETMSLKKYIKLMSKHDLYAEDKNKNGS